MSMNAHIIVHGIGGSHFLNNARWIWAAELINGTRERAFEGIIFTGGKTYGPDVPSEAEGMYRAFQETVNEPNLRVQLEEQACDTRMNATESLRLIGEEVRDSVIFLLSSWWHLPRIDRIYRELWVKHRVLLDTDGLVSPELQKWIFSDPVYKMGRLREPIARMFESKALQWIKRTITLKRIK
jgi:DUF218 domain